MTDVPSLSPEELASNRIDTSVPHPARRYDYLLGGKDNFAADRESAEAIAAAYPGVRIAAVENRRFMHRATRFLAGEAGLRQFLDIGTGIPTSPNLHEVVQSVAPAGRVVYVDNDPIVLVHARALLTSSADGAVAYLDADLRDPDRILADPQLRETIDLDRPVALTLIAILHFVVDEDDPYGIVRRLVDALPAGSYLTMTHGTFDFMPPEMLARANALRTPSQGPFQPRTRAEFARFFDGLELMEPGIQPVAEWRPDASAGPPPPAVDAGLYGAVARKS